MKKAFITGIGGQDGSYLAEYLLDLGYKVYGIVRRNSTPEHQQSRLDLVRTNPNLHVSYGDLNDTSGIERLLREIQPDEVYNIAAQSHVRISYEIPQFTAVTNAVGVVNMLEAVRNNCPNAKELRSNYSYRILTAKWKINLGDAFMTGLEFTGIDIVGVVKELTTIISENEKINMKSLNFDTNDGVFEGEIMLYVYDKSHLEKLIKKLRNINGIEKVVRIE